MANAMRIAITYIAQDEYSIYMYDAEGNTIAFEYCLSHEILDVVKSMLKRLKPT